MNADGQRHGHPPTSPGSARAPREHGGHEGREGHDPEVFRRRFWVSLALSVPLVVTSPKVQGWFGHTVDLPGLWAAGPVLGTAAFLYGGGPFLTGAIGEIRARAPGMMLLISMAIVVACAASMATTFGWFDLDFWWELATLVTVMLLGHWQETRAIGQARGALSALASLPPDQAERLGEDDAPRPWTSSPWPDAACGPSWTACRTRPAVPRCSASSARTSPYLSARRRRGGPGAARPCCT